MTGTSVITPNGYHYGEAYHRLSPKPLQIRPKIDSFLCGHCASDRHYLHIPITGKGKCECLLCNKIKSAE